MNGVNESKLFWTVQVIKGNPEIAKFNFKAKGKWVSGGHNRTTMNEFYEAYQIEKGGDFKNGGISR